MGGLHLYIGDFYKFLVTRLSTTILYVRVPLTPTLTHLRVLYVITLNLKIN